MNYFDDLLNFGMQEETDVNWFGGVSRVMYKGTEAISLQQVKAAVSVKI